MVSVGIAPITQYTHVRNKNINTQGSLPYVVKVIFHTLTLNVPITTKVIC